MSKLWREWRLVLLSLFSVLMVAFVIRVYNLTILPVFADEAIYIRWAQIMASEPTLRFLPLSDGKQPLFMWILMFVVRRFGDPLFIGRLISVFCGIGTAVGIFGVSYLLFESRKIALVSSLIWAVSPFAVFFDRMALVDSMLAMFVVWTLLLGVVMAKTRRFDIAMLTGFALGFASLTKSPAIFAAGFLPSAWVLVDWRRSLAKRFGRVVQAILLLAVVYIIALAMYNIQRLGPNFHMLTARTKDYFFPVSHIWENPRDPFMFYFHRGLQWIWIMGPWEIYVLLFFGLVVSRSKRVAEKLLLLVWFLGPLAVQAMFAKTFTARYIFFTLPPLYVLAGTAFLGKSKALMRVSFVVLIVLVSHSVLYDFRLLTKPALASLPRGERSGYLEEWTSGTGIFEAAELIKKMQSERPNDKFVVGTEGYFGTLPDGLQMYLDGVPNVLVIGVGLRIEDAPQPLRESRDAGNRTYLVVNSSRLNFKDSPEEHGYKVVAYWVKAERPDWTKEYLQYGASDKLYLLEVI